jgi:hypothetical protein
VVTKRPDGSPWSGAGGEGSLQDWLSGSHEGRRYAPCVDGFRESEVSLASDQSAIRLNDARPARCRIARHGWGLQRGGHRPLPRWCGITTHILRSVLWAGPSYLLALCFRFGFLLGLAFCLPAASAFSLVHRSSPQLLVTTICDLALWLRSRPIMP